MRYTIGSVCRHPTRWREWWIDLPMRQRWWWREVLFEPGAGWLCWNPDWRRTVHYDPPDLDEWVVYPPLRRAWLATLGVVLHPWFVLRGDIPWNAWPSLVDVRILKSDDRKRLFR